jgi:hypothetical protein
MSSRPQPLAPAKTATALLVIVVPAATAARAPLGLTLPGDTDTLAAGDFKKKALCDRVRAIRCSF